jgi:hypothetical protein
MGSRFSRCLGFNNYIRVLDPQIQIFNDIEEEGMFSDIALDFEDEQDINPNQKKYVDTEV